MTKLEGRIEKLENAVEHVQPTLEEALDRLGMPGLSEIEKAHAARDVVAALSHEERKELVALIDEMLPDE